MYDSREEREKVRDGFAARLKGLSLKGWTPYQRYEHTVYFQHESGAEFYVTLPGTGWAKNGKIEAAASYPKNADGKTMSARDWGICAYNETDPNRIGFSHIKSDAAIKRDLERRLIPGVLAAHAKIQARLEEQRNSANAVSVAAGRVAFAFGTEDIRDQSSYSAEVHFAGYRNHAYVRNTSDAGVQVDLELGGLTVAQVLAVARVLGGDQ